MQIKNIIWKINIIFVSFESGYLNRIENIIEVYILVYDQNAFTISIVSK